MWRQTSGWVTCAKPSRRNTDPGVSHTFSRRFSKQNYPKQISDVVSKILEKKNTIIRCFVWICDLPEIGFPVVKVENLYCQFFSFSPNRFWRIFSMLLNSHPTIKRRWKKILLQLVWCETTIWLDYYGKGLIYYRPSSGPELYREKISFNGSQI